MAEINEGFDLLLQMNSQDHAFRVVEIAKYTLSDIECSSVTELPLISGVLFENVTNFGGKTIQKLRNAPQILSRARRVLWLSHSSSLVPLSELLNSPPPLPNGVTSYRISAIPKQLETKLIPIFESKYTSIPCSKSTFSHCLHVYCPKYSEDTEDSSLMIQFCWVPTEFCYFQSPNEQSLSLNSIDTAVLKLSESLSIINQIWKNKYNDTIGMNFAIDVGAAPGAWSMLLAKQQCRTVIAIDPADLSTEVLKFSSIKHVRRTARDSIIDCKSLLGEGICADLICCDANVHPKDMIVHIKDLLPLLRKNGVLIWTLKFRGIGRNRDQAIQSIDNQFNGILHSPGLCIWLMANTNHERTYISFKI